MTQPIPQPGIMDIKPYVGGEGRLEGVSRLVRLASNENPLGCSPLAKAAYLKAGEELHRYPDGAASALRAAIGKAHGLDPERIVCGAGSEQLISLLLSAYAGTGDEVVYSKYGFLMYPLGALAVGAAPVAVDEKDLRTDIPAMLRAVTKKTKVVILANPNNPTGSYLTGAELKQLCDGLPKNVLCILDSAYAEYVREKDYDDGAKLVDAHPNVVMLRTFSKIHGLAALRLGWGYFPTGVADILNRVRGTFNVSAPAQAAGIAALEDKEFVRKTVDMAAAGRVFITEKLSAMGLKVYPSIANFILVEFGDRAEDIRLALKSKGIFVRQMGAYHLPGCLRISTGTPEDNAALVAELKLIL